MIFQVTKPLPSPNIIAYVFDSIVAAVLKGIRKESVRKMEKVMKGNGEQMKALLEYGNDERTTSP